MPFDHPTNTAVILDLKGFLINQKLFLSTSEYHYYYSCAVRRMSHDNDFQFHLPLCTYCLSIFYKSNLRMSIGYLQPLVIKGESEPCSIPEIVIITLSQQKLIDSFEVANGGTKL